MGLYTEYTIYRPSLSTLEGVIDSFLDCLYSYRVFGSNKYIVYVETDNCYSILITTKEDIAISIRRKESYCANSSSELLILKPS